MATGRVRFAILPAVLAKERWPTGVLVGLTMAAAMNMDIGRGPAGDLTVALTVAAMVWSSLVAAVLPPLQKSCAPTRPGR